MPKYSRTKKYEELRNKLQSDNEANISSKELSEYANRLNKKDIIKHLPDDINRLEKSIIFILIHVLVLFLKMRL